MTVGRQHNPELYGLSRPESNQSDLGGLTLRTHAKRGQESVEREQVEAEYHRMKPEEFDELMSRAKPRSASVATGSAARSRSKRKNKSTEKKRAA
jgi:ribosomal protein L12E/L44/L45/RPP1/RPP2